MNERDERRWAQQDKFVRTRLAEDKQSRVSADPRRAEGEKESQTESIRCHYKTASGLRCKNQTRRTGPNCWQHTVIADNLRVVTRARRPPELIARRRSTRDPKLVFKRGDTIVRVMGEHTNTSQHIPNVTDEGTKPLAFDGGSEQSTPHAVVGEPEVEAHENGNPVHELVNSWKSWAGVWRYAEQVSSEEEHNAELVNQGVDDAAYLVATRDIYDGQLVKFADPRGLDTPQPSPESGDGGAPAGADFPAQEEPPAPVEDMNFGGLTLDDPSDESTDAFLDRMVGAIEPDYSEPLQAPSVDEYRFVWDAQHPHLTLGSTVRHSSWGKKLVTSVTDRPREPGVPANEGVLVLTTNADEYACWLAEQNVVRLSPLKTRVFSAPDVAIKSVFGSDDAVNMLRRSGVAVKPGWSGTTYAGVFPRVATFASLADFHSRTTLEQRDEFFDRCRAQASLIGPWPGGGNVRLIYVNDANASNLGVANRGGQLALFDWDQVSFPTSVAQGTALWAEFIARLSGTGSQSAAAPARRVVAASGALSRLRM